MLAIAHHPARPSAILIGTEGAGIWLSKDGGETLAPRLVATVNVRVSALAAAGDTVFAALVHAGPLSGLYRSPDDGASFEPQPARAADGARSRQSRRARSTPRPRPACSSAAGSEWRRVARAGHGAGSSSSPAIGGRLYARTRDTRLASSTAAASSRSPSPSAPPLSIAARRGRPLGAARRRPLPSAGRAASPQAASLPFPGGELAAIDGDLHLRRQRGPLPARRGAGLGRARERVRSRAFRDRRPALPGRSPGPATRSAWWRRSAAPS